MRTLRYWLSFLIPVKVTVSTLHADMSTTHTHGFTTLHTTYRMHRGKLGAVLAHRITTPDYASLPGKDGPGFEYSNDAHCEHCGELIRLLTRRRGVPLDSARWVHGIARVDCNPPGHGRTAEPRRTFHA